MREYFRSLKFILVVIVLAFVATSVVYFGTSNIGSGRAANKPAVVATVSGEDISAERFRRSPANPLCQYDRTTRQRLTPDIVERLGLTQQVISELVNDAMSVQATTREGIKVTADELRARIRDMREFQEHAQFSRDRYLR